MSECLPSRREDGSIADYRAASERNPLSLTNCRPMSFTTKDDSKDTVASTLTYGSDLPEQVSPERLLERRR